VAESREPAPAPLLVVQELVNTLDVERGEDLLVSPEGFADWLRGHDLPGGDAPLAASDVAAAVELREALRALLRTNAGGPVDPAAIALVNRVSERSPLRVEVGADGDAALREAGAHGAEAAFARVLAAMYAAIADGTWQRLKACASPDCRWAFYDRSRNRSGHWCDMSVCGSRHKVRAYRARHAQAS
jgi:predicted RNA-binding Zn ribbon-like protein